MFEPRHFAALHAIRDAMGLDFFGVDCALDRAGNLVVFEANATMLVHADTGDFAYKNPYVRRIKTAFTALLARTASQTRWWTARDGDGTVTDTPFGTSPIRGT